MLFTFCTKELAMERIEILFLDSVEDLRVQLDDFDLNKAHCFSPTEEFRLRYIMLEIIGKEKFETLLECLKQLVDEKIKSNRRVTETNTIYTQVNILQV